jgi:hypothetical protein
VVVSKEHRPRARRREARQRRAVQNALAATAAVPWVLIGSRERGREVSTWCRTGFCMAGWGTAQHG